MSLYELFDGFWVTIFMGAPTEALDTWSPLFAMLSCVALVFAIFGTIYKAVFKRK